jgi:hypothetical protein
MDVLARIAEARLEAAVAAGLLSDLPGAGAPLPEDECEGVPAELATAYRILRNAGMVPEAVSLRRELVSIHTLLACCVDDAEGTALARRARALELRLAILEEA